MLDMMRRHSQSTLIYLIFGVIIIVFAFSFGPGSSSCLGQDNYAAKVEGEIIRPQEFSARLAQQLDYIRQSTNNNSTLSADFIEKLGIRKQIIDGLIDAKLLEIVARKRGLQITDEELVKHLKNRYGVENVSYQQYSNWVSRQFQLSVAQFEERARGEVMSDKLRLFLTENISISDQELREQYWQEHDRVMVDFIKFDPEEQKVDALSDDELKTYIGDSNDALKERYEKDKLKYRTPQMVQARQILRRLSRDASDADIAKETAFLKQLREQITQGADFSTLAKEHSQDDTSAVKGGDMGFIKRGQTIKPLEKEIFTLKTDEISKEPIKTLLGVHLVQVVEIKPPASKPFDDVKTEVARSILQEAKKDALAKNQAETLLTKLQAGGVLEELTQDDGEAETSLPVRKTTPWLQKDEPNVPRIGTSEQFHRALFTLTKESPLTSQSYKVGRSYFISVLKDREIPNEEKFVDDLDNLRQQGVWAKQSKVFRDWLKYLRNNTEIVLNPALFGPSA